METHSFAKAPSPTFVTLSEIISDLYMMALNRQDNKSNSNLLNGRTYARKHGINEEDSIADSTLWKKLEFHNEFIAGCIKSLSQSTWKKNHQISLEYQIPNWSQEE
ncbi:Ubiquitin carboxyl-terminal hydrolase 7 [Puccinia graminis f. sp. tritici]|uniref:Ubiquitin carboxyl-terminal hydrolase 7 n=1 Tax=Puccinia graminis f. sp. tritici TaxID=56615 RepID=A0A5B0LUR6_PUCGR|nr:Ubiquitin carboxyl-terminal hydrolase 7 [Puccinia graminis f. sp. tritici]